MWGGQASPFSRMREKGRGYRKKCFSVHSQIPIGKKCFPVYPVGRSNSPTPATGTGKQSSSECEPHRAFIQAQLQLRRNFTAIYQDLFDQFGFRASYNSVKRFAATIVEQDPEQFDRLEFAPEEVQVDYGEGALTLVPGMQRYRKPRLFVMTLRFCGAYSKAAAHRLGREKVGGDCALTTETTLRRTRNSIHKSASSSVTSVVLHS